MLNQIQKNRPQTNSMHEIGSWESTKQNRKVAENTKSCWERFSMVNSMKMIITIVSISTITNFIIMVIWVILDYHPLQILQIIITSIIFNIISILLIITITFMMMMIMIMLIIITIIMIMILIMILHARQIRIPASQHREGAAVTTSSGNTFVHCSLCDHCLPHHLSHADDDCSLCNHYPSTSSSS